MLAIVDDRNIFKVMALSHHSVLICRFQEHNLVLVSLCSWKMCFLLKYGIQKLQLELWNTNHEPLNRTLHYMFVGYTTVYESTSSLPVQVYSVNTTWSLSVQVYSVNTTSSLSVHVYSVNTTSSLPVHVYGVYTTSFLSVNVYSVNTTSFLPVHVDSVNTTSFLPVHVYIDIVNTLHPLRYMFIV